MVSDVLFVHHLLAHLVIYFGPMEQDKVYLWCDICNAACKTPVETTREAKIVHASKHPNVLFATEHIYDFVEAEAVIAKIEESGIVMEELKGRMIEDLEKSQGWGAQFN